MTTDCNESGMAGLGAAHGSASPVTDRTWELHNRGKCGLHYIAHKMREIEIEKNALLEAITATLEENKHLADGDNCTLIRLKRAVTPNGKLIEHGGPSAPAGTGEVNPP